MKKLLWFLIPLGLLIGGVATAINVTVPSSPAIGSALKGNANGTYTPSTTPLFIGTAGIGINSTTPVATLSVKGVAGTNPLAIASSTGTSLLTVNQNGAITLGTASASSGTTGDILGVNRLTWTSGTGAPRIITGSGNFIFADNTTSFQFKNNAESSVLMTILDTGNIGINTTTPTSRLEVYESSGNEIARMSGNNANGGYIAFNDNLNKTIRGFFGYGPTLFTTAGITDMGFRSAGGFAIGANGGSVAQYVDTNGAFGWGASITSTSTFAGARMVLDSSGRLGVGTTTPAAKLVVVGTAGTADVFNVASSTGNTTFGVTSGGWQYSSGTVGAVTSCGTGSGTAVGNDNRGTITTATAATSCTYTFNNPVPSGYQLSCTVTDDSLVGFADVSSTSTTAVVFGISSALTGGHLYYNCGLTK